MHLSIFSSFIPYARSFVVVLVCWFVSIRRFALFVLRHAKKKKKKKYCGTPLTLCRAEVREEEEEEEEEEGALPCTPPALLPTL